MEEKINIILTKSIITKSLLYPNDDRNSQWTPQQVNGNLEEELTKAVEEINGRGGAYKTIIITQDFYSNNEYVASRKYIVDIHSKEKIIKKINKTA